jgi:hypothetical protein
VPRVFAQKGNGVSVFGHFFCPFSQNFFDSCAMKNKNNKINLQDLYQKMRPLCSHVLRVKKRRFFAPKKA